MCVCFKHVHRGLLFCFVFGSTGAEAWPFIWQQDLEGDTPPPLLHAPPLTTANGLAPLGLGAALVSIGEGVGWGGVCWPRLTIVSGSSLSPFSLSPRTYSLEHLPLLSPSLTLK